MEDSYEKDTPVAVVYKASWPEEMIIYGTLETIVAKVTAAGITKTALVVVGDFLGNSYELSKLYDQNFETEYRKTGGK
jgi:precorrin-4/cobalt-precorrin-4 C11-methyltransferase